jgi:tRNA(fMet)-specific endonuclease VapC
VVCLDTSVCVWLLRGTAPKNARLASRLRVDQTAISTITLAELVAGAERSERRDDELERIERLCAVRGVWDFDQAAARTAGRVAATLETRGRRIGTADLLIGSHALSREAAVLTANHAEFERIPGLEVIRWA